MSNALLILRLARRELRGGIKGMRVFLLCLALGAAAIASVGSIAAAVRSGIAQDACRLLGGDIELRLTHRPATPAERAYIDRLGRASEATDLRAMARPDSGDAVLVELRAVDGVYPLYGDVTLEPAMALEDALALRDGAWGAAVDGHLLARLGAEAGTRVRIGTAIFELRAALVQEPDRAATAFIFGPRVLIGQEALAATGLVLPGSLIRYRYRVALPDGADIEAVKSSIAEDFPDSGWRVRGLDEAAPGVERFIERVALYLTLVGLGSLLVGGVGIGNAVGGYLQGKTATIATLKCLGATGRLVVCVYLGLVMAMAAMGVAAGLLLGALAPVAAGAPLAERFGFDLPPGPYLGPLAQAAGIALLTALAFSLAPLAAAREVAPRILFRGAVAANGRRLGRKDRIVIAAAVAALAGFAVAASSDRWVALWFVLGAGGAALAFRLLAFGVQALARRIGRSRATPLSASLRLALARLYRPGAATFPLTLSLGLALALLVALGLVQSNLGRAIGEAIPATAPAFYFIDIQPDQADAFDALLESLPGAGSVQRVPMLRGRIVGFNGEPAETRAHDPGVEWVLKEDRGITWASLPPAGSEIVEGEWWPADYSGKPLVSLDAEVAEGFGLSLGDTVAVNVLGRPVSATIANLRRVDWTTLAINFVLVFSPGLLEGAPLAHIATVHVEDGAETAIQNAVAREFPNVSAIRVKEALADVARLLAGVGGALWGVAGVAGAVGLSVLAATIAAGQRRRLYEAAILKALGAGRGQLLRSYLWELGLLGAAAGLAAAIAGTAGALPVVKLLMELPFYWDSGLVLALAALGPLAAILLGLAGTWAALGRPSAGLLRND